MTFWTICLQDNNPNALTLDTQSFSLRCDENDDDITRASRGACVRRFELPDLVLILLAGDSVIHYLEVWSGYAHYMACHKASVWTSTARLPRNDNVEALDDRREK